MQAGLDARGPEPRKMDLAAQGGGLPQGSHLDLVSTSPIPQHRTARGCANREAGWSSLSWCRPQGPHPSPVEAPNPTLGLDVSGSQSWKVWGWSTSSFYRLGSALDPT